MYVFYLLPEVLFSFIAGAISDNWDKKKIMLVSDTIAAVFSISVILLLFSGNLKIEYLYVINFILGITDAFQNPVLNIMTFSFLFCNGLLGIGRNYIIWTIAVFFGNILIPFLTANVEYIMRTKIPLDLQGRVFSARNTMQYISIPIGNITGGFLADKVFEPFMKKSSIVQVFLAKIVGMGNGSGIAVLFVCIAIIGFIGCCFLKLINDMRRLDYE